MANGGYGTYVGQRSHQHGRVAESGPKAYRRWQAFSQRPISQHVFKNIHQCTQHK